MTPPLSVQNLLDESMEYVKTLKMNEFKAKKAGTYQIASGSGGLVMIDATHWHNGKITIHDGEKLIATVASGSASVLSGIKFDSSLSLTVTGKRGWVGLVYYTRSLKLTTKNEHPGGCKTEEGMTPIYKIEQGSPLAGLNIYIEGDNKGSIKTSARARFISDEAREVIKKRDAIAFYYTTTVEDTPVSMYIYLEQIGNEIQVDARLAYPLLTPGREAFKQLFKGKEICFSI